MPCLTFNLVEQPWIPVAGYGEVSLRDIFTHPEYSRLGGTPVEKIVLLRLLLCIAHACCNVKTTEEWIDLTPEMLAKMALAYLEKWKSRFDLFDEEYPFLQFPQLKKNCSVSSLGALALPVANGNKTVFSQWTINDNFTLPEKARLILCGSGYGMGGGKYDLFAKIDPDGPEKRKKPTGKASAPQGTLTGYARTGYAGYLHTFMLGETILKTVCLNMLTEEELQNFPLSKEDLLGRPFWELMPTDENGTSAEKYRSSYQGILFPLDKFFCLDGENLRMTQGITYPTHKNGQWDPGIMLFSVKNDMKALWCNVEKKPWRQLSSLLKFFELKAKDSMPVFVAKGHSKLNSMVNDVQSFGIWTGGVSVSSNFGEQYVTGKCDYLNSEFLIPMAWKNLDSWQEYKRYMEMVNDFSKTLYGAVSNYHKSLMEDGNNLASSASQLFWEKMEPLAQSIIDLSEETNKVKIHDSVELWKRIAMSCFDWFCPHVTPRQIQAYAQNKPFFLTAQEKEEKKKNSKKKVKNG